MGRRDARGKAATETIATSAIVAVGAMVAIGFVLNRVGKMWRGAVNALDGGAPVSVGGGLTPRTLAASLQETAPDLAALVLGGSCEVLQERPKFLSPYASLRVTVRPGGEARTFTVAWASGMPAFVLSAGPAEYHRLRARVKPRLESTEAAVEAARWYIRALDPEVRPVERVEEVGLRESVAGDPEVDRVRTARERVAQELIPAAGRRTESGYEVEFAAIKGRTLLRYTVEGTPEAVFTVRSRAAVEDLPLAPLR